MKKTLFIFTVGMFVAILGNAQNTFPMDTVIHRPAFFTKYDHFDAYNLFDTCTVLQYVSETDYRTLINGISIDSCYNDKDLRKAILYANDMIYFQMKNSNSISTYSSTSKIYNKFPVTIHSRNWRSPVDLSKTQLFHDKRGGGSLLQVIDSKTGKESFIADFRPFTDTGEGMRKMSGSIEQVCAISKFSYIVKTGIWDQFVGDSYVEVKFYKVVNGEIRDLTETVNQWVKKLKIKQKVSDTHNPFDPFDEMSLSFLSVDTSYIRGIVTYWGSDPINRIHTHVIVNTNLQLVSPVLALIGGDERGRGYDIGINKQQGKIENYFMYSFLNDDDKNKVIVPYVFSPHLDTLMYKAYCDEMLKKEDLRGFNKYELSILRNLIFAKYNYAFSSEFCQAYFNLYEFYGNDKSRKSRVKNVDNLLTDIDKANIKLVKDAEAGL